MANNYTQNPITVDALMSASSYQNVVPAAYSHPYLRIRKIQWVGQTAGASFTIEDGQGNIIAQGSYVSADQSYDFADPATWRDFQVTQLTSGRLLLFLA
jgi:hypothetical protein